MLATWNFAQTCSPLKDTFVQISRSITWMSGILQTKNDFHVLVCKIVNFQPNFSKFLFFTGHYWDVTVKFHKHPPRQKDKIAASQEFFSENAACKILWKTALHFQLEIIAVYGNSSQRYKKCRDIWKQFMENNLNLFSLEIADFIFQLDFILRNSSLFPANCAITKMKQYMKSER